MTTDTIDKIDNPLVILRTPTFNNFPETFSEIYGISKISKLETKREFLGLGQEFSNACFIACIRSVLLNDFNIKFEREENMITLIEDINSFKKTYLEFKYDTEKEDIITNGAYTRDLKNIADFFGINGFNSNKPNIDEVKQLIDVGINPMLFVPVNKKDTEGHYIVAYAHDNENIYLFDPAYRGVRPRENIPHKGTYKKVNIEKFVNKWTNKYCKGGYVFLYDKRDRPNIELDGYYMT